MDIVWHLKYYFSHIFNGYPSSMWTAIAFYILFSIALGFWRGWRKAAILLALGYCILIMYLTVFSRPTSEKIKYCFWPFSSYTAIAKGDGYLFPQVLMNVVLFMPAGFFINMVFKDWGWGKVILLGICVSVVIELLQLVLHKGVTEIDDVIHNTMGWVLGCLVAKVFLLIPQNNNESSSNT